jgi:TDG/mug DNA glycosylase family protein
MSHKNQARPRGGAPWVPTREEIAAAIGKTTRDIIAADLQLLFCGVNPGLYSAAVGHHFGRPGNRFWPTLHTAGFTPVRLSPFDERRLLEWKLGITNIVGRATAAADELSTEELIAGAKVLERKVRRYRPAIVAVLGITAYRVAFRRPKAKLGRQDERIADAIMWVLPNPSGLNAHFQLAALAEQFAEVRRALDAPAP